MTSDVDDFVTEGTKYQQKNDASGTKRSTSYVWQMAAFTPVTFSFTLKFLNAPFSNAKIIKY